VFSISRRTAVTHFGLLVTRRSSGRITVHSLGDAYALQTRNMSSLDVICDCYCATVVVHKVECTEWKRITGTHSGLIFVLCGYEQHSSTTAVHVDRLQIHA
jgi:hypothetical protein